MIYVFVQDFPALFETGVRNVYQAIMADTVNLKNLKFHYNELKHVNEIKVGGEEPGKHR